MTPLVFVHGFPLDHRMWSIASEFSRARRVLAPDLPGFGGTPPPPRPGNVAAQAAYVLAQASEAGIDRAVFCGHSMGGYVLFEVLRRSPERVAGLVLCDTRPEPDSAEGRTSRDAALAMVETGRRAGFLGGFLPRLAAPASLSSPAFGAMVDSMADGASDAGLCAALEALRDRPDSRPLLATIRVPTLVVVGDEDTLTPPTVAQAIRRGVPGSRLEIIPGAGHLSPLEQPAAFAAALAAFLRDTEL